MIDKPPKRSLPPGAPDAPPVPQPQAMHTGLPVAGYAKQQSAKAVELVNRNKLLEEQMLRVIDAMHADPEIDKRWLTVGTLHIEQAFMFINRAVFKPARIDGDITV